MEKPDNDNHLDKRTYHHLLETFLPSVEMREYLKTQPMLPSDIILDLIIGAPVLLSEKVKWAWGESKDQISEALKELTVRTGEIFTLTDVWYDDDISEEKASLIAPFLSYQSAIEYIRAELAEYVDEPDNQWYKLEKWVPAKEDKMESNYTYWLLKDQLCFFDHPELRHACVWKADPNLPVPFHAGDLLTIDCRPFASIKHVLLLERGDNADCCCLQALYRDEKTGFWSAGAVKHRSVFGDNIDPLYTPIYRLGSFAGHLPREEELLFHIKGAMGSSELAGRWLCQQLRKKSKVTDHDLLDLADNSIMQKLKGPLVGPFFCLSRRLIADQISLHAARKQADKLDNPLGHEELFDRYRLKGDYIDYPRGRVIWDCTRKCAIIYIDPCVKNMVPEIVNTYQLKSFIVEEDDHYHCKNCAKTIIDLEWR